MHNKNYSYLTELGVSEAAIHILSQNASQENVDRDIITLLSDVENGRVEQLDIKYQTLLWTLLGELSIPSSLSNLINCDWPIMVFPFAKTNKIYDIIKSFLLKYECEIFSQEEIELSELLHTSLYGGQVWFPSLQVAYKQMIEEHSDIAHLFWFRSAKYGSWDTASVAKKLQSQLRPKLPSINIRVPFDIYPGIIKAFHTPKIENIMVHTQVFKLESWKRM